jgi:hypothetical protein
MKTRNVALLLALVVAATASSATTLVPMSVERLTAASEHVLEARALQSWSQWDASHSMIFTYTRFEVLRSMKGGAAQTVVVKQMGGRASGYVVRVAGVRYWHQGDEAVLFLRRSQAGDGTLVVTGLVQGNFRIERSGAEPTVSNGASGVRHFDPESKTVAPFQGKHMTLSELESRVRKAVER